MKSKMILNSSLFLNVFCSLNCFIDREPELNPVLCDTGRRWKEGDNVVLNCKLLEEKKSKVVNLNIRKGEKI